MALYDNKHWLLSHIKNSFISSDDTGICEMVMLGEDIPRSLSHATKVCCYPGADQSEGEDEMDALSHSLDIVLADMDLCSRPRCSMAQRLEKNDAECEKGERTKYIKWENVTGYDPSEFQRKDFRKKRKDEKIVLKQSLLVKQLENYPSVFRNPFLEYAKFDGDVSHSNIHCIIEDMIAKKGSNPTTEKFCVRHPVQFLCGLTGNAKRNNTSMTVSTYPVATYICVSISEQNNEWETIAGMIKHNTSSYQLSAIGFASSDSHLAQTWRNTKAVQNSAVPLTMNKNIVEVVL